MPSEAVILQFERVVWAYFKAHGRKLPWRLTDADGSFDVYKILVSEVMLQQTQVTRVIPKYQAFLEQFPAVEQLAATTLGQVLTVWSGLGYNRRAKYLHEAAQKLISVPKPWELEDLVALKGIGPNTAAAVCVYAYNEPLIFIETNIRTVFIHYFFQTDSLEITDKELLPLIKVTLDQTRPREWYWALMDYGSHLKSTQGNAAKRSQQYTRQSTFVGSKRQLRGQIIRLLTIRPYQQPELLVELNDERATSVIFELIAEGLITRRGSTCRLA